MWTEQEVRSAANSWRAAQVAMVRMKDTSGALLADHYASALELVLMSNPVAPKAEDVQIT